MRDAWPSHLDQGISLLTEIAERGLPPNLEEETLSLLSLCHLVRYRNRVSGDVPLVGIAGSASCGKSTLFNSIVGRPVSLVTPIPHQTTGAVLSVPSAYRAAAADPSFLAPIADPVSVAEDDTTGLTGSPDHAMVVITGDSHVPGAILMDLPDVGTVHSRMEHDVAVRLVPWLDRLILLVTEESFAQADHAALARARDRIHPDRARPELFVVFNRVHAGTSAAAFTSRLDHVRSLWPDAAVSSLPHLSPGETFDNKDTGPLIAESRPRVGRMLLDAIRNSAFRFDGLFDEFTHFRREAWTALRAELDRDLEEACRFRKSFFSPEFAERLDTFSPWRYSWSKIRSLGKSVNKEKVSGPVDLVSAEPVRRQAAASIEEFASRVQLFIDQLYAGIPGGTPPKLAALETSHIDGEVTGLVMEVNERARHDVETLLTALQKHRKVKDPLWSVLTAGAGTLLLLDLLVPSVGTLSTLTLSGLLSALGLGGLMTSDLLRRFRSGRLRETFESGLRGIMEDTLETVLSTPPVSELVFDDAGEQVNRWVKKMPQP